MQVVIDEDSQEISNIKIIDFGFSNYLSKLKERTSEGIYKPYVELLAGTPNYIAPEVLREEDLSFKIDNFAIGVMLYFM
jgi:serine/threonine protein kinase